MRKAIQDFLDSQITSFCFGGVPSTELRFLFSTYPPLKISDSRHFIPIRHIYTSRLISWLKQGKNKRLWAIWDNHGGQSQVFQNIPPTFPYLENVIISTYSDFAYDALYAPSKYFFILWCDFGSKISLKLGFPKSERDFLAICKTLHIL